MISGIGATTLGAIGTVVVGGIVAAVTVLGLVSSQVNSSADTQGNSSDPSISYGTNG